MDKLNAQRREVLVELNKTAALDISVLRPTLALLQNNNAVFQPRMKIMNTTSGLEDTVAHTVATLTSQAQLELDVATKLTQATAALTKPTLMTQLERLATHHAHVKDVATSTVVMN